jgi:hypothetical protein
MPTSVSALLLAKMKICVLCFLLENYKQIMPVMGRDILCSDDDSDVEVSLQNYAGKMVGDFPRLAVLCSSLLCRWFCFPTLHRLQAQISEGSLQQTCEMTVTGERISGFKKSCI